MLTQSQSCNYLLLATKINLSLFFIVCYVRNKRILLIISLLLQAFLIWDFLLTLPQLLTQLKGLLSSFDASRISFQLFICLNNLSPNPCMWNV